MNRQTKAAQTRAESPAPMVPRFTGIVAGLNQRAEESAPRRPASIVRNVFTGKA